MKLSVPPPPPPPPPSDGTPEGPNEQPDPTSSADASSVPAAAPQPKLATWPNWFGGVDAALVGLVLLLAFAAASFAARNSDLWVHLATGKRLFAGEYFPGGSDPFSYSAEGRTWVNHSWLADALMYPLYGGDGVVLVVAKALLVALTFGLLIAIRRPNFSLWPWAAVACVGVLAAAPQFTLRPFVASVLLLAVTLFLLFRVPHKKDSWQFPIAIGITFWVWASCDQWFFIGPLALALILVGDLIQKYGFNSPDEPEGNAGTDTLGRLPDTATLAKALGIGLLACTLTPNHVRVWELPFELVGAPGAESDPRLRQMLYAPYDNIYVDNAGLGYNANGLAYVILLVLGATVIGLAGSLGVGRIRLSHVTLWLGFAVLSFLSIYTIPFFVLVAVPLVASQLNAFSGRAELKTWGDPLTRLLLIGSSGGRVLSVLAVCLLCVLAYPGWVHPDANNPANARRLVWAVEPDPALVQASEQLKTWRTDGGLPADARGVITSTDLANYVAWFAPQEKVLINGRFNHHRRELADYLAIRKGLGLIRVGDEPPVPQDATDVLARRGAEYLALHSGASEINRLRLLTQFATQRLYMQWGEWSAWYTDGRTAVFGWRPGPSGGKPSFANLRLDPGLLAFGAGVKKIPEPVLQQPLAPAGWEEAFVRTPRNAPAGAAEAIGWLAYKSALTDRDRIRHALVRPLTLGWWAADRHALHHFALRTAEQAKLLHVAPNYAGAESDDAAMRAIPLLAIRAARRAIAEDPDHPDGYYALAQALADPDLPLTDGERALGRVTAYRQCLVRLPRPDQYKRGQFAAPATAVALELSEAYLGTPLRWRDPRGKEMVEYSGLMVDAGSALILQGLSQPIFADRGNGAVARAASATPNMVPINNGVPFVLAIDAAHDALRKALEYAPIDFAEMSGEDQKNNIKQVENRKVEIENTLILYKQRYETGKGPAPKLFAAFQSAIRNCMLSEALELLKDADFDKEFGESAVRVFALQVSLALATGRIEDAADLLKVLTDPDRAKRIDQAQVVPLVQMLKYQKSVLAGEYKAAGDVWDALNPDVGQLEKLNKPPGPEVPRDYIDLAARGANPTKDPAQVVHTMLVPPFALVPGHDQVLRSYLWLSSWDVLRVMIQRRAIENLKSEADFFYRRGVLFLLEGDIPAAKERFKESHRKPPAGWGLPSVRPPLAEQYLQLIERAEKQAAKP